MTHPPTTELDLDAQITEKLGIDTSPRRIRVAHRVWRFKAVITQAMVQDVGKHLEAGRPEDALAVILLKAHDAPRLMSAIEEHYSHDTAEEAFLQTLEAGARITLARASEILDLVDQALDGVDLSGLDDEERDLLEQIRALPADDPASRSIAMHLLGRIGGKVTLNRVDDEDTPVEEDGDTPAPK